MEDKQKKLIKKYHRAKDKLSVAYLMLDASLNIFNEVEEELRANGINIIEIDPLREDLCM